MSLFHSLWTVVVLITFVGIIVWAFSKSRQASFDAASRLPLEEDQPLTGNKEKSEHPHV